MRLFSPLLPSLLLLGPALAAVIPYQFLRQDSSLEVFADFPQEQRLYSSGLDDNTSAVLISSRVLASDAWQSLGLQGSLFDLHTDDIDSKAEHLFLPTNTKSLFLFNLKAPGGIHVEELSMMMPFDTRRIYNIKNVALLVPKSFLEKSGVHLNDEFFQKERSATRPGVAFRKGEQPFDFSAPILGVSFDEDPIAQRGSSAAFFDAFSRSWASSQDPANLMHSVSCSIQQSTGQSVCIKIGQGLHLAGFFPNDIDGFDYSQFFQQRLEKREEKVVPEEEYYDDDNNPLLFPGNGYHSPRSSHYAQVIFPDLVHINQRLRKRSSGNDEDCALVTWSNVFKHALFGYPELFCNVT